MAGGAVPVRTSRHVRRARRAPVRRPLGGRGGAPRPLDLRVGPDPVHRARCDGRPPRHAPTAAPRADDGRLREGMEARLVVRDVGRRHARPKRDRRDPRRACRRRRALRLRLARPAARSTTRPASRGRAPPRSSAAGDCAPSSWSPSRPRRSGWSGPAATSPTRASAMRWRRSSGSTSTASATATSSSCSGSPAALCSIALEACGRAARPGAPLRRRHRARAGGCDGPPAVRRGGGFGAQHPPLPLRGVHLPEESLALVDEQRLADAVELAADLIESQLAAGVAGYVRARPARRAATRPVSTASSTASARQLLVDEVERLPRAGGTPRRGSGGCSGRGYPPRQTGGGRFPPPGRAR